MFGMTQHLACRCHVMERESFEDDATAELLNNSFVSIKVDREERPDVDKVYVRVNRIYTALQPPVVIYLPSCNTRRHTNQNCCYLFVATDAVSNSAEPLACYTQI